MYAFVKPVTLVKKGPYTSNSEILCEARLVQKYSIFIRLTDIFGKNPPNFTVLYAPYFRFEIKAAILKDLTSSKSSLCFIQICPIYLITVLIRCQQDYV